MGLTLTKVSETATKITLGWTPAPGVIGYRFQSSTQAPKWSHTWDPTRSQVTFSKAEWYKVEALGVEEAGEYPPVGPGDKLRYAPPTLSNPITFDLTNANRQSGFLRNGAGRDLRITCREVLRGPLDEMIGWRNIVWIGGEFASVADSSQEVAHIIPRVISGTLHLEGIKFRSQFAADVIAPRFTVPYIQIQNCDLEAVREPAEPGSHSDCFQTQYATIEELRVDKCTIRTSFQGFFLSNEPNYPGQPLPSKVGRALFSRLNCKPGPQGVPHTYLFKAIPPRAGAQPLGPWVLEDVWIPNADTPDFRVYPSSSGRDWAGNPTNARCLRVGNTLEFSPECGITGVVNLGSPADFATGAGMQYVSPGYV
jgi:hypothetical protein